jgi:hypothetical protein
MNGISIQPCIGNPRMGVIDERACGEREKLT